MVPQLLLIFLLLPLFPEKGFAEKPPTAASKAASNATATIKATTAKVTTGKATTRRTTTPRTSTPKATTPKATTPRATTPKATTPRATTPRATTPRATTPRATTPKSPTANPTATSNLTTNTRPPHPKGAPYFYRDLQGPGTYEFGYHIDDEETKNIQFREETRHPNGTITGSYGYLRPDGKMTVTDYIADEKGFRKRTKVSKHPASNATVSSTTAAPGLNLNSGTLPPQLVERVKDQYQIDLSPDADPGDILHPNISDIINGKVPLTMSKNGSAPGFEVVKGFIPKEFPIVPFQLPDPNDG